MNLIYVRSNRDVINLGSFRAWWYVWLVLTQFGIISLNMDPSHLLEYFMNTLVKQ